ncbi:hypothetical protein KDW_07700 [Dictyobacter vulcani]|uniref:Anaphase-promoting complex subunit 4 WD40 domain-containing protein n=1 Tax=Dictyobacter vulcani TaxID=2607529 RepID=A0A5J4KCT0_9CHLR|nr:hypothetical protein [Dictyobacter vulcani]GER86608.1 hypothetical protein KDW_07700 [Dictyobacter vulcani]
MNQRGRDDHEHSSNKAQHSSGVTTNHTMESNIAHFLRGEAEKIHFTPALRARILQEIPSPRSQQRTRLTYIVLASATAFILVLSGLTYLWRQPEIQTTGIYYVQHKEITVAPQLANGGQLLSLDPTEQRIVYQPANQAGVLYMADLINPVQSNALAMRYARDMAWAPDGSALVATVLPPMTAQPLLALVPNGQYMHLLGQNTALAADWSPTHSDQIMFARQQKGQTQLWSTNTSGAVVTLQLTMHESLLIHHMNWSPNGQYLALIASQNKTVTRATLDQPGRVIYIMDIQTHKLNQLMAPGNFQVGNVSWSPDGHALTFEQINPNQKTILQTVTINKPGEISSITPKQHLDGWTWSPDGHALVYSDGGRLSAYVFHGSPIIFPQTQARYVSPFWLKNGQILCMNVTGDKGVLTLLTPQKK